MYKIIVTVTLLAAVLSSCSNEKYDDKAAVLTPSKPVAFTNNIETDDYWGGQATYKKVPNAHSGDMVSLIDEKNGYSVTFHHKLIDLPDTSAKKVSISAWVNYADTINATAILAIGIDNTADGKNLAWLGSPVEKMTKIIPNEWIHITFDYIIPKMKLTGNENLGICFWINQSKVPVMIDDFEVKITK